MSNPTALAREASVKSLRELIIILTGLTIASGFGVSMHSIQRFFSDRHSNDYVQVWWNYFSLMNDDRFGSILRLLLLIICVIRFQLGNLYVLEKYYLIRPLDSSNQRNLLVDFVGMIAMSIALSGMGFSIFEPVIFNTAYMLILVFSVFWIAHTLLKTAYARGSHNSDEESELGPQFVWFLTNISTLFVFVLIYISPGIWRKSEFLSGVIFLSSAIDFYVNRKELFPRPLPQS